MWPTWMRLVIWASLGLVWGQAPATSDDINSLAEQRSDIALSLAPNFTQWEQLLLPTPTVVKLLGQMVLVSARVDVSLANQEPKQGWQFVANPRSLRASLLQVGNEGWKAFQVAHGNMEHIALSMAVVPRHVRTALRILGLPSIPVNAVTRLLRSPLEAIQRAGESSFEKAVETSEAFLDVMGLTGELSVAVTGEQGRTDQELETRKIQLEAAKALAERMAEQRAFMRERYENQSRVVAQAQAAYEKAIKKIPTGFKAWAMDLVSGIAPSLVGGMAGGAVGVGAVAVGAGLSAGGGGGGSDGGIQDPMILQTMRSLSERLPELEAKIEATLAEAGEEGLATLRSFFFAARETFETTADLFKDFPGTAIRAKALEALEVVAKLSRDMEERLKGVPEELSEEAKAALLAELAKAGMGFEALLATGIQTGDAGGHRAGAGGGSGGGGRPSVGANERFIAASRLQRVNAAEASLDQVFADLNEFNERLTMVEARIDRISLETVNLRQVRELLREVLAILGHLRELWSRLVLFFQLVVNQAEIINRDYLRVFREMAAETGQLVEFSGGEDRDVYVALLRDQALDIQAVAHLLETMASTYVRVSGRHVLGKLAGLAKLLGAEEHEQAGLLEALKSDAEESKTVIEALIREQRTEFAANLRAKRERLSAAIAELGGTTPEEAEALAAGNALAGA